MVRRERCLFRNQYAGLRPRSGMLRQPAIDEEFLGRHGKRSHRMHVRENRSILPAHHGMSKHAHISLDLGRQIVGSEQLEAERLVKILWHPFGASGTFKLPIWDLKHVSAKPCSRVSDGSNTTDAVLLVRVVEPVDNPPQCFAALFPSLPGPDGRYVVEAGDGTQGSIGCSDDEGADLTFSVLDAPDHGTLSSLQEAPPVGGFQSASFSYTADAAYHGGYTNRDSSSPRRLRGNDRYPLESGEAFAFTLDRLQRVLNTIDAGDAVLLEVAGDALPVDRSAHVLPPDAVPRLERLQGPEHLHDLVPDRLRLERPRRLHREERQNLEQMVLQHVADGAGLLVVRSPALHAERLGDRDLQVVDGVAVPHTLEERVGEAENQDVLDRFLAQEVVDPEDLGLVEHAAKDGVELFDFGRCTEGSGTHRFKQQWGGRDEPLWWYQSGARVGGGTPSPDSGPFAFGPRVWRRLPLAVANVLGPRIVKYLP